MTYGYRYSEAQTGSDGGFNLLDFGKALLTGGLVGGASSAAFYGGGKAVEALESSIRKSLWGEVPLSLKLGDDETVYQAIKNAGPSTDKEFRVFGHGNANGIEYNGELLDANRVAHLIRNSKQYIGGDQMVVLYSCETGMTPNGFAQQLANNLGVNVKAPNSLLYPTKTGGFTVANKVFERGKWAIFNPNK